MYLKILSYSSARQKFQTLSELIFFKILTKNFSLALKELENGRKQHCNVPQRRTLIAILIKSRQLTTNI